jgi:hypothetical protein
MVLSPGSRSLDGVVAGMDRRGGRYSTLYREKGGNQGTVRRVYLVRMLGGELAWSAMKPS